MDGQVRWPGAAAVVLVSTRSGAARRALGPWSRGRLRAVRGSRNRPGQPPSSRRRNFRHLLGAKPSWLATLLVAGSGTSRHQAVGLLLEERGDRFAEGIRFDLEAGVGRRWRCTLCGENQVPTQEARIASSELAAAVKLRSITITTANPGRIIIHKHTSLSVPTGRSPCPCP